MKLSQPSSKRNEGICKLLKSSAMSPACLLTFEEAYKAGDAQGHPGTGRPKGSAVSQSAAVVSLSFHGINEANVAVSD